MSSRRTTSAVHYRPEYGDTPGWAVPTGDPRETVARCRRILDLFCCEGGASKGYADAGFEVVGVDLYPQPRYPYEFHCMDAMRVATGEKDWPAGGGDYSDDAYDAWHEGWRRVDLSRFDAIHASPPCQRYSKAQRIQGNEHPDLIGPLRKALKKTGLPYVIENVMDARHELRDPHMLCGTMFGLRLYRHRLFETNWPYTPPLHGQHYLRQVKMGRKAEPDQILQPVGNFTGVDEAREAMGMPWASRDGLREAIPPAYTEHIGQQLLAHVRQEVAA